MGDLLEWDTHDGYKARAAANRSKCRRGRPRRCSAVEQHRSGMDHPTVHAVRISAVSIVSSLAMLARVYDLAIAALSELWGRVGDPGERAYWVFLAGGFALGLAVCL